MLSPMNTAEGSPSRRAKVSRSAVVLRTSPSTWSTSTRISVMKGCASPSESVWSRRRADSNELARGEELDELVGPGAIVGHDLPGTAWRPLGERLDGRPGGRQPDLVGGQPKVGDRERLDRL